MNRRVDESERLKNHQDVQPFFEKYAAPFLHHLTVEKRMIAPYDGNENLLQLAWNGRPIEMVYVDCGRTREVNEAWHSIMSGFLGRICGVYHTSMTHRLPCPENRHRGKDFRGGALAGQASSITRRVLARTCPPRSPAACRIALVPSGRRIVPSTRRLVRAWHAVPPRTADMMLVYRAAFFPPPPPAQQSEGRTEDEPRRATSVSQGARTGSACQAVVSAANAWRDQSHAAGHNRPRRKQCMHTGSRKRNDCR